MSKHSYRFFAKLAALAALSAVGMFDIAPAQAGSASADLSISASVSANCTISTAPIAFGAYDGISMHASQPLDASGSVTVQCTSGAAAAIGLGQGAQPDAGSSDDSPLRRLKDAGSNHLSYALFSDAARSVGWGNSVAADVEHTGTGLATMLTVYGRIAAGQNVPAGAYGDTVLATVNF